MSPYTPGKRIPIENVDAFCFPHGVEPKLLERTPSMSAMVRRVFFFIFDD